jgi:hypothetical protein
MTTGSFSEREGVLYVAQDYGLFRKYGLDLTLVQVRQRPRRHVRVGFGRIFVALGISISRQPWGDFRRGGSGFVAGFINKLTETFVANRRSKTRRN